MGVEVLYILIPASLLLAGIALALFFWSIHSGQFDDLQTPAIRILDEEDDRASPPASAGTPPSPAPAHPAQAGGRNASEESA